MTNVFGLDNLVYTYPDQDDVTSGTLLKRREFSTLRTPAEPYIINPGEYFNYQEFGRRFMLPNDRLLSILDPGTGKTCYDIAISERFHLINEWIDTTIQLRNSYKRAYFVTTSDFLLAEFSYQFICRCTDGRYAIDKLKYDIANTGRSLTINEQLDKFYTRKKYTELSKDLNNMKVNGKLIPSNVRDVYDNCIFFFDEAHYFRNNLATKGERSKTTIDEAYKSIYEMLSYLTNFKIIISTATPMIDKSSDFVPLLNLLNVGLGLPVLSDNTDYDTMEDLSSLRPYIEGKIAYVKAAPIGVKVEYKGMELKLNDNHSTTVVPLLMSEFQSNTYMNLLNNTDRYGNGIYTQPRLISTYTNPNVSTMNKSRFENAVISDQYSKDILENIENYSIKFKYILDYIRENDERGIRKLYFIYWDLLEGGLNDLSNVLNINGYDIYDGDAGIFSSQIVRGGKVTTSKVSSYCASSNSDGQRILTNFSDNFPKKKRFSLLSGSTKDTNKRQIKEAFTHPDNRHGEYIQIIIGSAVTRLGLNFENVTEMFFIGPSWNYGDFYQAMYRILRTQSHLDLIVDKRNALEEKIRNNEEITEADRDMTITVNIHRLCAIPRYVPTIPEEDNVLNIDGIDLYYSDIDDPEHREELLSYLLNNTRQWRDDYYGGTPPVIDAEMYLVGEEKEVGIRRILRYFKQFAIDCPVNNERNMTGESGSLGCDFTDCTYQCIGSENVTPSEVGSITDAYNALYLGPKYNKILEYINIKLRDEYYVQWIDIYYNMGQDEDIVEFNIFSKISHLIYNNIVIDKYGIPYTINVNNDGIFLDRSIINNANIPIINTSLLHNIDISLNSLFLQVEETVDISINIIRDIKHNIDNGLNAVQKQRILEEAYGQYIRDELSPEETEALFDVFGYYMVQLPKKELIRSGNLVTINTLANSTEYMHFFFNELNSYAVNTLTRNIPKTREGSIRIYDTTTRKWRNITEDEKTLYLDDINEKIHNYTDQFGDTYGYRNILDYKFRIATPISDIRTTELRLESTDSRRQVRGSFRKLFDTRSKFVQIIFHIDPNFPEHAKQYINDYIELPDNIDYKYYAEIYRDQLINDNYNPYSFTLEQLDEFIDNPNINSDIGTLILPELLTFIVLNINFSDIADARIFDNIDIEQIFKDNNKWFFM